jgi:hypothetical protein
MTTFTFRRPDGRLPQVSRFLRPGIPLLCDVRDFTYASLSNSVRYLGAIAFTFSMNAACSFSPSFGGGVVRVATGTPTSMKNFSCPAGEQTQSMRTGLAERL